MNLKAGSFLRGNDPDDPQLGSALILLTQCDGLGAAGFVLDRLQGRCFNELQEFSSAPALPLYWGGPVDQEHLFFLHRRPELIDAGTHISGELWFGGHLAQALEGLRSGRMTQRDICMFIGYCGWDAGDLERELASGYWTVASPGSHAVLS